MKTIGASLSPFTKTTFEPFGPSSIPVRRIQNSRIKEVDFEQLEFGKHVSDHMLIADYANGKWGSPQVLPFANLSLSPTALALHYGQTVFEGMKAFKMPDGRINVFRMDKHYDRFVKSLERMCMAVVPKDIFVEGIKKLVEVDRNWIPERNGSALYIRPFVYASEARFGVKVSDEYRFIIFTGPVPPLYASPIRVKVERDFIRAARGGTGYAKCGGNYGGAFFPTQRARAEGYDQVIWMGGQNNEYIEESGMMNIMFVIDDELITPPLSDSILDGVTRDSLLQLARDSGLKTTERPISIEELKLAFRNKSITEAFGAGTAAVAVPIKTIFLGDTDYRLPKYNHESVFYRLQQELESIRTGRLEDRHSWNYVY